MAAAELDRLFVAIRRTRDPDLLAALFERTAPWLLHRAQLLLGQAGLAEDVVQDLFLGLLENGHGCEPGRPCLPYLLGILHRKAARIRRQEARTLTQSLREAAATPDAPIDAAIGAEARAAVRRAIDALPEPYRDVVRRFVAGQAPTPIGRALGRTPNAVRVQLHRGLRLLRATLPPGLLVLLWAVPAQPAAAQSLPAPRRLRGPLLLGAVTLAVAGLATWLGTGADRASTAAGNVIAGADAVPAAAVPRDAGEGTAIPSGRTEIATAATGTLALELRHADGSPAAAVGVLAHRAGRDPDFGTACAVSGADGRVLLPDLPTGTVTVLIDRGLRLGCVVQPGAQAPQVVVLPAGIDVTGTVRDAEGRPAPGAGIWLCRELRCPSEGSVVARADADGRFELRGLQPLAVVGAVREGSAPSQLQAIGPGPQEVELVLGGEGARVQGRVRNRSGTPVAGAIVRIARHPRAHFQMPGGGELQHMHPCAVVRTEDDGAFAVADLPPGPMQVLVRAPRHRTALESVDLAGGREHRLELCLHAGMDLDGEVRDQAGAPVAEARVLARGLVRSAWASVSTAPDGTFALVGLDPGRVVLEVEAPGFAPFSLPVARDPGKVAVVLQTEARIALRLQDARGTAAAAPAWELGALVGRGGPVPMPVPLEPVGDGFVAAGAAAAGPFVVRRQGTQMWLRAEPAAGDPTLLGIPAAAETTGPLALTLPGTTAEQRAGLLLVVHRDGIVAPIVPADPTATLLDFGRVPVGDQRAVLYSPTGALPAIDLGVVAVAEAGAPLVVEVPAHGWLRYRLQRTDREPVLQCLPFVTDQQGLQVPLFGTEGRVALVAGRYQLWASSLSFPTVGHLFEVAAAQETVVDLQVSPGKVRHLAFRLPPGTDPQQCRARVRPWAERDRGAEGEFPRADRGFDTTADGLCYTTLVLAEGEYRLDVQCGGRTLQSRFGIAGEDGVAEPIEVGLGADR